jgi:hypothetical protein
MLNRIKRWLPFGALNTYGGDPGGGATQSPRNLALGPPRWRVGREVRRYVPGVVHGIIR